MSGRQESLYDILKRKRQEFPDFTIFTFLSGHETEAQTLTYGNLLGACEALASRIQQQVKPGQRVLLIPQGQADFIIAFLACLISGTIAVPAQVPKRNKRDTKLVDIINNCSPNLIIGDRNVYEKSASNSSELLNTPWLFINKPSDQAKRFEPIDITPEMPAMIQYTSGTLGQPKGVLLSHSNIMANSKAIQSAMALEEQKSFVNWLPHYHDMGLFGSILEPIISQVPSVFLSPLDFVKKPVIWLRAISKYKATISGAPNFGYQHCLDMIKPEDCEGLDLSYWKVAYCGAELVQASTLRKFHDRFAQYGFKENAFMPCYGMAEATLMITCGTYGGPIKTAIYQKDTHSIQVHGKEVVSCGQAPENSTLRIVKDSQIVKEGEVGEIWVKGANIGEGYWDNETETQKSFSNSLNKENGFLRTGDLGFIKGGELYLTGRLKEMIICRGRNFYPQDIEYAVYESDVSLAKGRSAAFSVEEESEKLIILQEVKRNFWKKPDYNELIGEIFTAVSNQLEIPPDTIAILKPGALPRTSSGKISRQKAKKQFLGEGFDYLKITQFASKPAPPSSKTKVEISAREVQDKIRTLLEGAVDINQVRVQPHSSVFELGIDSVTAIDLTASMEELFGIDLDPSLLWQFETVAEISQYIFEHKLSPDNVESV